MCIAVYGNMEALSTLINDNAFLNSYSYALVGGETIFYNPNLYRVNPRQITATATIASTIKTKQGQSMQNIFDILIQTYGRMDDLLMLMNESGFASFGDYSANGKTFTFDESKIQDLLMYAKLKKISSGLLGFPGGGGGTIVVTNYAFQHSAFSQGFA